ncbi:protein MAIN-LIKE 2-like [Camellia sinensis]|uniref:protein MAIN-LIKE 2-like n=1 Tax=Camellia sinensis TaxID=4442 RepID=UPI0010367B7B|nr:protein MAIN-LIKE 2-like [Camellia sinensis]
MDFEYQQRVPSTASNRRRRELDVDHERGQGHGRGRGRGRGRGPLKCHNHSSKILVWPWWSVDNNIRFKAIIEQSGLSQLARCTYRFVNKLLISSFVKRWQLEMNTFHMTVGEMTLTLDDVGTILSLSIVGRSVSVPDVTYHHGVTLLVSCLGITKCVAHEVVSTAGGNSVRLE